MTTLTIKSGNFRKKICIFKGDCSTPTEECELIKCKNELEIIDNANKISYKYDITLWIGYNTIGFDYMYFGSRLGLFDEPWPKISLLKEDTTTLYIKEWKSAAYGINYNHIPMTEGIIHIDMMLIIKRGYKLDEYNLSSLLNIFSKQQKRFH